MENSSIRKQVKGRAIPVRGADIDTDRIIPARFLRTVTFDDLGQHAFEDDRVGGGHPFDEERFQGAAVLVTNANFGCGSSREHAPQSLMRWGIKVIIAESFAEIFFGNCTSLGIPAVTAAREDLQMLCDTIQNDPSAQITVNLETQTVQIGDQSFSASMPESARSALTTGNWDFLAQLLEGKDAVQAAASQLPYVSGFAS